MERIPKNPQLQNIRANIESGLETKFLMHNDGSLRFYNRLCVPNNPDLKRKILGETYNTS